MHHMDMDNGFFALFSAYWWLLFPLGWAIFRMVRLSMEHLRAEKALDLIKDYADKGKEVPPELLKVLQQPGQSANRSARDKSRAMLVPVFVFLTLAVTTATLLIGQIQGKIASDDPEALWGMTAGVVLFLGFATGFFVLSRLYDRDSKRQDPP